MNKTLATIVTAFTMAFITTAGFAADSTKAAVSETLSVKTPLQATDTAEKKREREQHERNMKAKSLSQSAHKPGKDAASAKKNQKLQNRNQKARENTNALAPKDVPAAPTAK